MSSYSTPGPAPMLSPRKATSPPRARTFSTPREVASPHTGDYTRRRPAQWVVPPPASPGLSSPSLRPPRSSRSPSPETRALRSRAAELQSSSDHLLSSAERWALSAQEEERWAASAANRLRATLAATQRDATAALSAAEAEAASAWWQAGLEREAADAAALEADSVKATALQERAKAEAANWYRADAIAETERARAQAATAEAAARSAEVLKSQAISRADQELSQWRHECEALRSELGNERLIVTDEKRRAEAAEAAAVAASSAAEEAASAAAKLDAAMHAQANAAERVLLEQQAELAAVVREREKAAAERYQQSLEDVRTSRADAVARVEARAADERQRMRVQLDTEKERVTAAAEHAIASARREFVNERDALIADNERRLAALDAKLTTSETERKSMLDEVRLLLMASASSLTEIASDGFGKLPD